MSSLYHFWRQPLDKISVEENWEFLLKMPKFLSSAHVHNLVQDLDSILSGQGLEVTDYVEQLMSRHDHKTTSTNTLTRFLKIQFRYLLRKIEFAKLDCIELCGCLFWCHLFVAYVFDNRKTQIQSTICVFNFYYSTQYKS